jgi:hypothetical protein
MSDLCCCKMCLDHVTAQVEFLAAQKFYDEMVQKRYRMRSLGYHWCRYTCGWASDEVERLASTQSETKYKRSSVWMKYYRVARKLWETPR